MENRDDLTFDVVLLRHSWINEAAKDLKTVPVLRKIKAINDMCRDVLYAAANHLSFDEVHIVASRAKYYQDMLQFKELPLYKDALARQKTTSIIPTTYSVPFLLPKPKDDFVSCFAGDKPDPMLRTKFTSAFATDEIQAKVNVEFLQQDRDQASQEEGFFPTNNRNLEWGARMEEVMADNEGLLSLGLCPRFSDLDVAESDSFGTCGTKKSALKHCSRSNFQGSQESQETSQSSILAVNFGSLFYDEKTKKPLFVCTKDAANPLHKTHNSRRILMFLNFMSFEEMKKACSEVFVSDKDIAKRFKQSLTVLAAFCRLKYEEKISLQSSRKRIKTFGSGSSQTDQKPFSCLDDFFTVLGAEYLKVAKLAVVLPDKLQGQTRFVPYLVWYRYLSNLINESTSGKKYKCLNGCNGEMTLKEIQDHYEFQIPLGFVCTHIDCGNQFSTSRNFSTHYTSQHVKTSSLLQEEIDEQFQKFEKLTSDQVLESLDTNLFEKNPEQMVAIPFQCPTIISQTRGRTRVFSGTSGVRPSSTQVIAGPSGTSGNVAKPSAAKSVVHDISDDDDMVTGTRKNLSQPMISSSETDD